ncbi:hypothetical protein lerEdw1_016838, partial [Lerista edwardsae]
ARTRPYSSRCAGTHAQLHTPPPPPPRRARNSLARAPRPHSTPLPFSAGSISQAGREGPFCFLGVRLGPSLSLPSGAGGERGWAFKWFPRGRREEDARRRRRRQQQRQEPAAGRGAERRGRARGAEGLQEGGVRGPAQGHDAEARQRQGPRRGGAEGGRAEGLQVGQRGGPRAGAGLQPAQAEVAHQPVLPDGQREEDAALRAQVERRHGQGGQGLRRPEPQGRQGDAAAHVQEPLALRALALPGQAGPGRRQQAAAAAGAAALQPGQAQPHPARALRRGEAPQQGARGRPRREPQVRRRAPVQQGRQGGAAEAAAAAGAAGRAASGREGGAVGGEGFPEGGSRAGGHRAGRPGAAALQPDAR